MEQKFNTVDEALFFEIIANYLIEELNKKIEESDLCTLVLSGGRTPLGIFDKLVNYQNKVDWEKVELYWLDERCVSHDSPESNFGMAKRYLIDLLQKKPKYYPMYKGGDFATSAQEYEELLYKNLSKDKKIPIFDLALIGIGSDGHVASIFPNGNALEEQRRLVMHEYINMIDSNRITMTLRLINQFRKGVVVSRGEDKSWVINECKKYPRVQLPIGQVNLKKGSLEWFICC